MPSLGPPLVSLTSQKGQGLSILMVGRTQSCPHLRVKLNSSHKTGSNGALCISRFCSPNAESKSTQIQSVISKLGGEFITTYHREAFPSLSSEPACARLQTSGTAAPTMTLLMQWWRRKISLPLHGPYNGPSHVCALCLT